MGIKDLKTIQIRNMLNQIAYQRRAFTTRIDKSAFNRLTGHHTRRQAQRTVIDAINLKAEGSWLDVLTRNPGRRVAGLMIMGLFYHYEVPTTIYNWQRSFRERQLASYQGRWHRRYNLQGVRYPKIIDSFSASAI